METLEAQTCPVCFAKTLNLSEDRANIPHFGNIYIMTMDCESCGFRKSDIDSEDTHDPVRLEFEISEADDLTVRFVKSSEAHIFFPDLKVDIEPGVGAEGYVANLEKALEDLMEILNQQKEAEESKPKKKKLRQMIETILDAKEGKAKLKIIVEDPTGNSAIISEKTVKFPLKSSKKKGK